jgi:hypothetical protein
LNLFGQALDEVLDELSDLCIALHARMILEDKFRRQPTLPAVRAGEKAKARRYCLRSRGGALRRAKGGKRDPKALEALVSKLHSAVKSKPGQRVEEIARSLGTSTKELMLPMRKLRDAKKVQMKGTRRAARYFSK